MMGNYQVRFLEGLVAVMQPCLLGEHKMFSYISKNWRGRPLISREVVVSLIGATKTSSGLEIMAILDENNYEAGIEISDEEIQSLNIIGDAFHPEWNYAVLPKVR